MIKIIAICLLFPIFALKEIPDSYVHMIFCDVGQGDAILLTNGYEQMLVDGGPDNSMAVACLEDHLPFWDKTLEFVVVTHPDKDHYGGLEDILSRYEVENLMLTSLSKESTDFLHFREVVSKKDFNVYYPQMGDRWMIGDLVLVKTLSPREQLGDKRLYDSHLTETQLSDVLAKNLPKSEDYNAGSIVLLVEIGEVKVLLTGDISKREETALINSNMTPKLSILKVAHHGSKTSTSTSFLQRTRPEISIISCGKNNNFGHPSTEVVSALERGLSTILRTDELGSIEVVSDGHSYWIK